jgi:Fe-S-cluster containining protein
MNLPVLESPKTDEQPWFSQGLRFTCSKCGNCCTGGPGFVWVSRKEVGKLAELLGMSRTEVTKKYCRKINGRLSLREIKHPRTGGYDCIFMKDIPAPENGGEKSTHTRRICTAYAARPLQCRTWPFWDGNLASPKAWQRAARTCLGMNRGEFFNRERIESLRDAQDWPGNPPTSATD